MVISINDERVIRAFHADTRIKHSFCSATVSDMLDKCKPDCFSELVKVYGLAYGTGTWHKNAELLMRNGNATLNDIIAFRDDIFNMLRSKGMERERAYDIMNTVKMG